MQDLRITLVQPNPAWQKVEENLNHFPSIFAKQKLKTDVIVLPEMFTTGFTMESKMMAEKMNGRTHVWMQEQARKLDAVISGSVIVEDKGNFYNRFLWVEPDGSTTAYDKRHLFRMADENDFYSAGIKQIDISYKGWKIRPMICYDLRFPVWARNSVKNDKFAYDILLYVANWPQARITAWDTLLKARAIENAAYSIGVNRVGKDEKGIVYNGHSSAFDPKGSLMCVIDNIEDMQTVTLKQEPLVAYRKQFPVFLDTDDFKLEL